MHFSCRAFFIDEQRRREGDYMRTLTLGSSSLEVPVMGIGCMRMADRSVEEVQAVVDRSMELGLNFFDHADIYGAGKSEEIFAAAVKKSGWTRDTFTLQSKVGIGQNMFDFSKEHIIKSVEGILGRLETDYLDVLLLHRPDALMEPEEVAAAFAQLEEQGKVSHFGVSNQNQMQMELLKKTVDQPLITNQLQFGLMHTPLIDAGLRVNMVDEKAVASEAGLLDYCRLHNLTVQAWSPLMYGFFEGVFIGDARFPEVNALLSRLADKYEEDEAAIAIAWILRHPAKMQPMIGSMTPKRIQAMAEAASITLTRKEWYELYLAAGNSLP